MSGNGGSLHTADTRDREPTAALSAVAEDLAGELSLGPLLERILMRSTELLGSDAGAKAVSDELIRIDHGDFA